MKILVCAKQVPDPQAHVEIDQNGSLTRPGQPRWQMNRYDEFAVEAAVAIKKARPGVTAEVVSLGPPRTAAVLERAIGMGCDQGAQIITPEGLDLDARRTAACLAGFAQGRGYDLILCGVMSEDAMQAQVGPMLAALLGWPWATAVVALELDAQGRGLALWREAEGGERHGLHAPLPAVVCVQSGLNKPRYPSLSNLLRAKGQEHARVDWADLPAPEPLVQISGLALPQRTRQGLFPQGDATAKAQALARILRDKALI